MNKYIYSICYSDSWPNIESISGKSYSDAVEKLVEKFTDKFEDDNIAKIDNMEDLQDYLNYNHEIVISDLTDYEAL